MITSGSIAIFRSFKKISDRVSASGIIGSPMSLPKMIPAIKNTTIQKVSDFDRFLKLITASPQYWSLMNSRLETGCIEAARL
ncbi:hypothetical protein ACFL6O_05255 [candidate division KSB1 bacterium]